MYDTIKELESYKEKITKAISFYENVKKTLGQDAEKKLVSFVFLLLNDPNTSNKKLAIDTSQYLTPTLNKCMYRASLPNDPTITYIVWDEVDFAWYIDE
jgi:hypothetical protein